MRLYHGRTAEFRGDLWIVGHRARMTWLTPNPAGTGWLWNYADLSPDQVAMLQTADRNGET